MHHWLAVQMNGTGWLNLVLPPAVEEPAAVRPDSWQILDVDEQC